MAKTKVIIYKGIPKKDFESHYGKYAWGVNDSKYTIHLKGSIKSKKLVKGIIRHELGHIFSVRRRICGKIPKKEQERLLQEGFLEKNWKEGRIKRRKERVQEVIADLWANFKHPHTRKVATKRLGVIGCVRVTKVITEESKKFKPTMVIKQW